MAKFYRLTVDEVRQETANSVSISFLVPEKLREDFSFIPGQYITVKKEINGDTIRRDYSICSSTGSGKLKIGIKAVKSGTFSPYATSQIKEGDELEVSKPQGRFNLITHIGHLKKYIAFAAGSGITPIMSMINSVLEEEPSSKFVLVYGNKNIEEAMFKNEIDQLIIEHRDRFFVHYIFSQEKYTDHAFGRIDRDFADTIFDAYHTGIQFDDYFICGPEPMINEVKAGLKNRKIDDSKVHFELFTSSTTLNDESSEYSGETEITVLLDDELETFTMQSEKTILESVLLQGLDAPYSCQGGICSTCIAQLTEGKAVMEKNSILTDDEIQEGLILTCQAHPITPKIVVDYDNV